MEKNGPKILIRLYVAHQRNNFSRVVDARQEVHPTHYYYSLATRYTRRDHVQRGNNGDAVFGRLCPTCPSLSERCLSVVRACPSVVRVCPSVVRACLSVVRVCPSVVRACPSIVRGRTFRVQIGDEVGQIGDEVGHIGEEARMVMRQKPENW
jgi:hypothetical protein